MSWDFSSEEVILEKLENQKLTISMFAQGTKKLREENARLREVLEFYADTSNYLMSVQDKLCRVEDRIKWDDLENYGEFELLVKVGGKRARKALGSSN